MNAGIATIQLFTNLFSSAVYNGIYTQTLDTFPEAAFLVAALLAMACVSLTFLLKREAFIYKVSTTGSVLY